MLRYSQTSRSDGGITIQIGRTKTELRTSAEAEAFISGFKLAHIKLTEAIMPLLNVKDSDHE